MLKKLQFIKVKGKDTSPLRRSSVDHTVFPANTPHLPLPVVRQGVPRLNEQLQHQLMKLTTH